MASPQNSMPHERRSPREQSLPSSADEPTRVTAAGSAGSGGSTGSGALPGNTLATAPTIEGYSLKEELHRGGQGIVYRAVQLGTKRQVALKVLLEGPYASETTRRRFEREIELAASLRHPNIVTILDSGLSLGRYYFAMEYIAGVRLDRYLAQQRTKLDQALILFEKVCLAVNFAHQRGVIHRDLKPPNILVDADGEPHVLDFGLAKPTHVLAGTESTIQMLSQSGQLLGTVAYMSPEQAAGTQEVDVRSDVYSLGVIFYEAVVGHPPYAVDGPLGEVLSRIGHEDPAHPRSLARSGATRLPVGDELATILLKALEKEPQRRYQTAGDLARDFRHLRCGEPIEAKRASGLYMLKKTLRRYRLQTATAGLILLMLFGFLITLAVLLASERDARARADAQATIAREAVERQNAALREAQQRSAEALVAQQNLRRAVVRQLVQRGDLALEQSDLRAARESYWRAFDFLPGPAATWALRRYYLQTADNGAARLAYAPGRSGRLAPDGRTAAVLTEPPAIVLRSLGASESAPATVPVPGPVAVLDVRSDGAVAAAGTDGWIRAWEPGALRPSVATQLPDAGPVHAVFAARGGRAALVVAGLSVRLIDGPSGENIRVALLHGEPTGVPDFAPDAGLLAVPTRSGLDLITLMDDGALNAEQTWSGATAVKAARFTGDLLAVLADGVYLSQTTGNERGRWLKFLESDREWDLFDLQDGVGTVALGTRAGRIAVYRSGNLLGEWDYQVVRLEQLCLADESGVLLTLDEQGVLTEWGQPERIEQRRLIQDIAPVEWVTAADGSAALLATARGQVVVYAPGRDPHPQTILRPRLLELGGRTALAINGDGTRAVIRDRGTIRLVQLTDLSARILQWSSRAATVADRVALSSDGTLLAVLARSPSGDRQQILLHRWDRAADELPAASELPPLEFVGAEVREILFVPGTDRLLVVRSNGHLLLIDPVRSTARLGAFGATDPWLTLNPPALAIAVSRSGEYLAAACADGALRIIDVHRRQVRERIPLPSPVSALSFNPRDDVLLARTTDGMVTLLDPSLGEILANWPVATEAARPLATWISADSDAMLLGQGTGVYEFRYAAADAVIERNRGFSREEQVARLVGDGELTDAWQAADALGELDARRGQWARDAVYGAWLRRTGGSAPPAAGLEIATDAGTALWFGHAAYAGGRFELAREWLSRGLERAGDAADAVSAWRKAQCDYVLGDYAAAEAGLARVLAAPDFPGADLPAAMLQRVAALLLQGRLSEARQLAVRIGTQDPRVRQRDIVGVTYGSVIARLITGMERESAAAAAIDSLIVGFGERPLLFRDDEHFFAGELARVRGDLATAAVRYQRCIDLARDEWPANWARYRLRQLGPAAGAAQSVREPL